MNIKQIIKECLNKNSIKIQELVNEELNSKTKKLVEDYTPSVSSRLFENVTKLQRKAIYQHLDDSNKYDPNSMKIDKEGNVSATEDFDKTYRNNGKKKIRFHIGHKDDIADKNGNLISSRFVEDVSYRLFENDMNHDEIMKGLNSPSLKDRKNAIQHPKATSKHIDKALDDSNWSVRYWAAKHPNVNFQNIEKALSDSHEMVRAAAMNHPNMEKY